MRPVPPAPPPSEPNELKAGQKPGFPRFKGRDRYLVRHFDSISVRWYEAGRRLGSDDPAFDGEETVMDCPKCGYPTSGNYKGIYMPGAKCDGCGSVEADLTATIAKLAEMKRAAPDRAVLAAPDADLQDLAQEFRAAAASSKPLDLEAADFRGWAERIERGIKARKGLATMELVERMLKAGKPPASAGLSTEEMERIFRGRAIDTGSLDKMTDVDRAAILDEFAGTDGLDGTAPPPAVAADTREVQTCEDEWSERIREAFPTRSGSHAEYAMAKRMVGNRHSKGDLVALVNYLLVANRTGTRVEGSR